MGDRKQNDASTSSGRCRSRPPPSHRAVDAAMSAQSLCAYEPDRERCMDALHPLTDASGSMDPKKVLRMAVKAAGDHIDLAIDVALNLSKAHGLAFLSACKELLGRCATELRLSLASVQNEEVELLSADIKNWLSVARTYQETCRDSLACDLHAKRAMEEMGGPRNATQRTSNALAAMANITGLLDPLHVPPGVAGSISRNLVEDDVGGEEAAEEGRKNIGDADRHAAYSSWLSERDRRTLAAVQKNSLKPNAVVAGDGSGNFKSITEALNAMAAERSGKYMIYVKAGTYTETVTVTEKMTDVLMYGDGSTKALLNGDKAVVKGVNQPTTDQTGTFSA